MSMNFNDLVTLITGVYSASKPFATSMGTLNLFVLSVCAKFRAPSVNQILCPYQLEGTCNDLKCQMMHI